MNEDFPDIGAVWSLSAAFQRIEDYLARISPSLRPFLFDVNKPDKRTGRIFRFANSAQKLRFQTAYTFDLARLFPGRRLSRIKASTASQSSLNDPTVNTGEPVGDAVSLGPFSGPLLMADAGPRAEGK